MILSDAFIPHYQGTVLIVHVVMLQTYPKYLARSVLPSEAIVIVEIEYPAERIQLAIVVEEEGGERSIARHLSTLEVIPIVFTCATVHKIEIISDSLI